MYKFHWHLSFLSVITLTYHLPIARQQNHINYSINQPYLHHIPINPNVKDGHNQVNLLPPTPPAPHWQPKQALLTPLSTPGTLSTRLPSLPRAPSPEPPSKATKVNNSPPSHSPPLLSHLLTADIYSQRLPKATPTPTPPLVSPLPKTQSLTRLTRRSTM